MSSVSIAINNRLKRQFPRLAAGLFEFSKRCSCSLLVGWLNEVPISMLDTSPACYLLAEYTRTAEVAGWGEQRRSISGHLFLAMSILMKKLNKSSLSHWLPAHVNAKDFALVCVHACASLEREHSRGSLPHTLLCFEQCS